MAGKNDKSGEERGKRVKGGELDLCEQFTDTDSTLFTSCQYYSVSTTFETGTRWGLQGKVRSRGKKKRPFEKHGGIGNNGIGQEREGGRERKSQNPHP